MSYAVVKIKVSSFDESMSKEEFLNYIKPFIEEYNKQCDEVCWHVDVQEYEPIPDDEGISRLCEAWEDDATGASLIISYGTNFKNSDREVIEWAKAHHSLHFALWVQSGENECVVFAQYQNGSRLISLMLEEQEYVDFMTLIHN